MRRFLTLSLLSLLALAMPLQGAAAITMTLCGPIHERMMGEKGDQSVNAHHGHAAANVDHAEHYADAGNSAADSTADTGIKYSCSACAACCLGGAMSAASYDVSPLQFVSIVPRPPEVSSFEGIVSDGPYHPPRIIL